MFKIAINMCIKGYMLSYHYLREKNEKFFPKEKFRKNFRKIFFLKNICENFSKMWFLKIKIIKNVNFQLNYMLK